MKLLLTVVALVVFTHAAPTTHTLEVGSNGIVGSVDSPLVSIAVNILKDENAALIPGAALAPVAEAEPVIVVDAPVIDVQPVVVDSAPEPVNVVDNPIQPNPVDVISVSPVVVKPNPIDIISVNPAPNPIDVISVSPVAPNPIDVISVNPVIIEPNPIDVISVNPVIVEPTPVDIVPVNPVVVPEPVQVVDVTPGLASVQPESSGNQIINVILNFVFGSDGSLSSVEVPAQSVQQIIGAAQGLSVTAGTF